MVQRYFENPLIYKSILKNNGIYVISTVKATAELINTVFL
jgi:hypothetical protein